MGRRRKGCDRPEIRPRSARDPPEIRPRSARDAPARGVSDARASGALGLGDKSSKVYPTRNVMLRRRNDTEWAEKGYFEYGDITEGRIPPVDERGELTFVKALFAGGFHSLAIDSSVRREMRARGEMREMRARCARCARDARYA